MECVLYENLLLFPLDEGITVQTRVYGAYPQGRRLSVLD